MTRRKGLVLDAKFLLRTVFGQRVRELLEAFEDAVIRRIANEKASIGSGR